jgi:hypothetical protein
MTNTIIWKVEKLERKTVDGFVTSASWVAFMQNDVPNGKDTMLVYQASKNGDTKWDDGQPTTPYDQLTEDQVLSWIFLIEDKNAIESELIEIIEAKKNPVKASGLPWKQGA